jgi:hypothetical protein
VFIKTAAENHACHPSAQNTINNHYNTAKVTCFDQIFATQFTPKQQRSRTCKMQSIAERGIAERGMSIMLNQACDVYHTSIAAIVCHTYTVTLDLCLNSTYLEF